MTHEESSWLSITENANSHYLDFSVNTNSLGIPDILRQKSTGRSGLSANMPGAFLCHIYQLGTGDFPLKH